MTCGRPHCGWNVRARVHSDSMLTRPAPRCDATPQTAYRDLNKEEFEESAEGCVSCNATLGRWNYTHREKVGRAVRCELAKTQHWRERAARRHDSIGPAANCGRRRSWTQSVSQAVALVPRRLAGSRMLLIHNLSVSCGARLALCHARPPSENLPQQRAQAASIL